MALYFKYGEIYDPADDGVNADCFTYGAVCAATEQQFSDWLLQEPYMAWSNVVTYADYCDSDNRTDLITEARERSIAKNIALAVARKRREKVAYRAPTLAGLWPTGE